MKKRYIPFSTWARSKDTTKTVVKKRRGVGEILLSAFKRTCTALGFFVLVMLVYAMFAYSQLGQNAAPPSLPKEMVLFFNFDQDITEINKAPGLLDALEPPAPTVRQVTDALDGARSDDRVKGLYVRLGSANLSLAQAQELRAAVKRFRQAGKFAVIYSTSYGGASGGMGRYYFASAFDERWMQPLGVVSIAGVRLEVPFARAALEKLGVTPQFFKREEYKTAYESLTNKQMSEPNREMLSDVLEAIRMAMLADIPSDIGMEKADFEELVSHGLFTSEDALQAGLITHADYPDNMLKSIKDMAVGDPEAGDGLFVSLGAYAGDLARKKHKRINSHAMAEKDKAARKLVALIYAVGPILETDPSAGGQIVAAADEIAGAVMQAGEDDNVAAIVLRVDSPGGSPAASEMILRALNQAQDKGKKVVVSMGDAAASGGYWIASGADRIFALPTTLTGSIGVVGGKFALDGTWEKIGVNWNRSLMWGDNAGIWSFNAPFTESEEARVEAMLDYVYSAFLERVADGRGMSLEVADSLARGRVWTGASALENGLVDEIGGLHEALAYVAEELGYEDQDQMSVVQLPRPKSTLDLLMELLAQQGMVFEGLRLQGQVMEHLSPILTDGVAMHSFGPLMAYEPLRLE
jgi:protease-4